MRPPVNYVKKASFFQKIKKREKEREKEREREEEREWTHIFHIYNSMSIDLLSGKLIQLKLTSI